jgi:hypothetical protein
MLGRVVASVLLLGTLVPFAALLPGGASDPLAAERLVDWLLGTLLCAGVGGLVAYLHHVRRTRGAIAPHVAIAEPALSPHTARVPAGLVVAALLLYLGIALCVFSGRPLLIDEIVQVLQARTYAAGRLWDPVVEPRVFFSILHVVDLDARVFGQYPAGGPAMLVPAAWLGAEWVTGPVVGALTVWLFWLLTRQTDPLASRDWRLGATGLFAVAPFGAFMFGSHMNHATTLLWLMVAMVALARATAGTDARPRYAWLAGTGLGIAATIRPLDAVAFALPAALWLLWRVRAGRPHLLALAASGIGVAAPMALLLWVNARTTGDPFTFGYDLLWGAGHGLGFHTSPWGPVHTPLRGVELVGLSLSRLSTYLFETPFPSLAPAIVGLWLSRSMRGIDRYFIAAGALLLGGYWAYWHDGFYLGPRFVFALLPALILWSARAAPLLRDRLGPTGAAWRGVQAGVGFAVVYAVVTVAVVRVPSYRNGMTSMRVTPADESARAGVRDALVLVQESWGAQLVVRLWEAGVSRSDAEVLYRGVDACVLEHTLRRATEDGVRGAGVVSMLRRFLADSARLVASDRSPDFTEKMMPGLQYSALCEERIARDQQGFLHLAPWRLARDSNVYARWIPGREAEIAAAFPDRAVYRLSREGPEVGAPLRWERLELERPVGSQ